MKDAISSGAVVPCGVVARACLRLPAGADGSARARAALIDVIRRSDTGALKKATACNLCLTDHPDVFPDTATMRTVVMDAIADGVVIEFLPEGAVHKCLRLPAPPAPSTSVAAPAGAFTDPPHEPPRDGTPPSDQDGTSSSVNSDSDTALSSPRSGSAASDDIAEPPATDAAPPQPESLVHRALAYCGL